MARFRIRVRCVTRQPPGWWPWDITPHFDYGDKKNWHEAQCKDTIFKHGPVRYVWFSKPRGNDADCPVCQKPLERITGEFTGYTIWCDGVKRYHTEFKEEKESKHVDSQVSDEEGASLLSESRKRSQAPRRRKNLS